MNELEFRIRVQTSIQQFINQFMINNQVPAMMMEDALNKVLVELKDKALQEFLASVTAPAPNEPISDNQQQPLEGKE